MALLKHNKPTRLFVRFMDYSVTMQLVVDAILDGAYGYTHNTLFQRVCTAYSIIVNENARVVGDRCDSLHGF